MKKILFGFTIAVAFVACNTDTKKEATSAASETPATEMATTTESKYTAEMVANKKDPICQMPVTAGISDTAQVDGKAYGFCSPDCKAEYVKDPKAYADKMQ